MVGFLLKVMLRVGLPRTSFEVALTIGGVADLGVNPSTE